MKLKYDLCEVEVGCYEEWVKNGYFKLLEDKLKEIYIIVILLLNVIGKLYLGYVWDMIL